MIQDVRLFDGFEVTQNTDILVVNNSICRIGADLPITDDFTIVVEGEGKTIIPGLINAHVHAWIPYHLQNAMEAGVFAVLDMHSSSETNTTLRKLKLTDGFAKFYTAGFAATVENGHGTQYWFEGPLIGVDHTPEEFVTEVLANGSDYIKIIYEHKLATLSLEQIERIIKESHSNSKLAVAHISTYHDALDIVSKDIDGLVHMWNDSLMSSSFTREAKRRGTFIVPTLTLLQEVITYYEENEIAYSGLSSTQLQEEVGKMSDAGVLLLAGTDAPNVGLDYGWSLHKELELFVEAGLTPVEALKTATSNVSTAFSIDGIGTIREGQIANFNLVDGNPTRDITHSKNIIGIWAEGKRIK